MSLCFSIRQYINPQSQAQGTCYEEAITQSYDFMKRGVITVSLNVVRSMCNAIDDPFKFEDGDGGDGEEGIQSLLEINNA